MSKPPVRAATDANSRDIRVQALLGKAARYLDASAKIKPLEAEKKRLSSELKEGAVALGTKDDKGTYTVEEGQYVIKSVASSSTVIDHAKAIAVLANLKLLDRCTTRVVDEKQLEICFQEGLIDIEDINSFTATVEGTAKVSVTSKA